MTRPTPSHWPLAILFESEGSTRADRPERGGREMRPIARDGWYGSGDGLRLQPTLVA